MTDMFETRMGRKFYESDIPALLKALNRIADAIEQLTVTMETEVDDDG